MKNIKIFLNHNLMEFTENTTNTQEIANEVERCYYTGIDKLLMHCVEFAHEVNDLITESGGYKKCNS